MNIDKDGDVCKMMDQGGPAWFQLIQSAWFARSAENTRLRAQRDAARKELAELKDANSGSHEFIATLKAKCETVATKSSEREAELQHTIADKSGTIQRLSEDLSTAGKQLHEAERTLTAVKSEFSKESAARDEKDRVVEERELGSMQALNALTNRLSSSEEAVHDACLYLHRVLDERHQLRVERPSIESALRGMAEFVPEEEDLDVGEIIESVCPPLPVPVDIPARLADLVDQHVEQAKRGTAMPRDAPSVATLCCFDSPSSPSPTAAESSFVEPSGAASSTSAGQSKR
jgi:hypothetical protein